MRPLFGLLALVLLAVHFVSAAEPLPDARKALDGFYKERGKPFTLRGPNDPPPKVPPTPWESPLEQLASEKTEVRATAAEYLRELLALALKDELTGKARWRNTPFWGAGPENPARNARKELARELRIAKPCAEVLPVLKWYLEKEPDDSFLEPIVTALGKVEGADADAIRAELATKSHPNATVTAEAIQQITVRKKTLAAETLAALCHHHRTTIRDAARALNSQQGGRDPGPFDSAKAVRSAPVAKVMEPVLKLIPELPAANAEFVKVTIRYLDQKRVERQMKTAYGWLIQKDDKTVEIYSPRGHVRTFSDKEKTQVHEREKMADGGTRFKGVDVVTEVTVAVAPAELVRSVIDRRKNADPQNDWFNRRELEEVWGSSMTLFEAIFGAWLYRAGKDAEAAAILLPALESLYRDDDFPSVIRHQFGELVGRRMLVAFVGARDYAAAIRHAQRINDLYPGTRFHDYATELLGQLPTRMDDFNKFRLPTRSRWAELKATMTRDEQIDFLCQRMRLLNCFQTGQPGGHDPAQKQFAEPCGLGEDAAWGGRGGETEVINPFTELTGRLEWRGEKRKLRGLRLTVKDIPRISKYLREDHFALIVSFWRDFAPDRHLTRTPGLFASIINEIAHEDICSVRGWDALSSVEIDKEIERINKWAEENQHKVFEDEEDRGEQVRELLKDAAEEPGLAMTFSVAVLLGGAILWRLVARFRRARSQRGGTEPRDDLQ